MKSTIFTVKVPKNSILPGEDMREICKKYKKVTFFAPKIQDLLTRRCVMATNGWRA
jgi:hypothetical protein